MLVAETVLGNVDEDPELAARAEQRPPEEVEAVVLDERERRRSRIRTTTDAGTDVGIVVDSDRRLSPGDVLVDDDERMVVVTFEDREALVISFEGKDSTTDGLLRMAQLGYQVGNRHWDLAVRDEEVLVALGTDSEQKLAEVTAALPPGARTRREMVDPTLFDGTPGHGESADGHTHDHDDHGGHTHGPASHTHDHSHDHGIGYRTVSTDGAEEGRE